MKSHRMTGTPIYRVWSAMKRRCLNPRTVFYENYGGRGITVCDRWMNFEGFYSDMGTPSDGQTLDRIDNNKGYSKENCRWVSYRHQARNRRSSANLSAFGETKTIAEWSEDRRCAVTSRTLQKRVNLRSWPAERAITEPPRQTCRSTAATPHYAHRARKNA